ncbi:hypothetical protein N5D52_03285 [Pseudomonas sp. GD03860]|nr:MULTISPECIES: hypothetical protein [Pseudomonas]MDD2057739.1 hypothetical protein [Pseudomonas putida]MDH0635950.1 hypothetical protein [Pseudomonas sp. GD03860]
MNKALNPTAAAPMAALHEQKCEPCAQAPGLYLDHELRVGTL